jgi:hypothetical protein
MARRRIIASDMAEECRAVQESRRLASIEEAYDIRAWNGKVVEVDVVWF